MPLQDGYSSSNSNIRSPYSPNSPLSPTPFSYSNAPTQLFLPITSPSSIVSSSNTYFHSVPSTPISPINRQKHFSFDTSSSHQDYALYSPQSTFASHNTLKARHYTDAAIEKQLHQVTLPTKFDQFVEFGFPDETPLTKLTQNSWDMTLKITMTRLDQRLDEATLYSSIQDIDIESDDDFDRSLNSGSMLKSENVVKRVFSKLKRRKLPIQKIGNGVMITSSDTPQ